VDRVNGVNAAELVKKVRHHARVPACGTDRPTAEKVCCTVYFSCILISYFLHRLLRYAPHTTTVLRPFFWVLPGEPVPEENFWTLWCKGRLTEADTQTIRLGATPSGLTSAHLNNPPIFTGRMPFLLPRQQRQSTEIGDRFWYTILEFNEVCQCLVILCSVTGRQSGAVKDRATQPQRFSSP